jgi:hypothetical protein
MTWTNLFLRQNRYSTKNSGKVCEHLKEVTQMRISPCVFIAKQYVFLSKIFAITRLDSRKEGLRCLLYAIRRLFDAELHLCCRGLHWQPIEWSSRLCELLSTLKNSWVNLNLEFYFNIFLTNHEHGFPHLSKWSDEFCLSDCQTKRMK